MIRTETQNSLTSSYGILALHPAAVISAARQERPIELARLIFLISSSVAGFFSVRLESFRQARKFSHAVKELEALSDAMLDDIGIARGDIHDAVRSTMRKDNPVVEALSPLSQVLKRKSVTGTAPSANSNDALDMVA